MKRIILIFIVLASLLSSIFAQQNLKIIVRSDNSQALPFATVRINDLPVSITDTLGVAYINISAIKSGDVISASYVGTTVGRIFYNDDLLKKGGCELLLMENSVISNAIRPISLTSEDAEQFFRKSAKVLLPATYVASLDANYSYYHKQTTNNQDMIKESGNLTLVNTKRFKPSIQSSYDKPWYSQISRLNRSGGTSPVIEKGISFHVPLAMDIINRTIFAIQNNFIKGLRYAYLGDNDGFRMFRISIPETEYMSLYPFTYQLLLYVDARTKDICMAELVAEYNVAKFSANESASYLNSQSIVEIYISTDLESVKFYEPYKDPVLSTKNLWYAAKYPNGVTAQFRMSNERIRSAL